MLDVHVIADDQLARELISWSVLTVAGDTKLGSITKRKDGFLLETVTGERSVHQGLHEARDAATAVFSAPRRLN